MNWQEIVRICPALLEGYIRLKADACTSSKELYEVYKMWCEENSLNAIKARGFSDALIANQRRYNLESTNNMYDQFRPDSKRTE